MFIAYHITTRDSAYQPTSYARGLLRVRDSENWFRGLIPHASECEWLVPGTVDLNERPAVLSVESATQYVVDYFAQCGDDAPRIIHARESSINGAAVVLVVFELNGRREDFTVWLLESGKLYGEW